jgi:hypothetical protein
VSGANGRRRTPANGTKLLFEMLVNREAAIEFDFTEIGLFRSEVEPPQVIHTIPHNPWQEAPFKIPRALEPVAIKILKARIDCGMLKRSRGPYRKLSFLVKKKQADHCMVAAFTMANTYTTLEAALPPWVDEFTEEFAGMAILSILDLFSGYDQMILAEQSRDMTAIQMPLGLLRVTRMVQVGTNTV